jgi:S-adenosyl methyltransferase
LNGAFPGFHPERPNDARVIDYLLGGKDNFAADRAAAERAIQVAPELPAMARESRKFLRRVVRYLVGAGIRQFVDVGCGLPTQGYVHETAQAIAPDVRAAYVDIDPIVVTHAAALLGGDDRTVVIQEDMRHPQRVLSHPKLKSKLNLAEPVGVLLVGVLPIIPEDDIARRIVDGLRDGVAAGSYLALTHAISDVRPEVTGRLAALFQDEIVIRGVDRRANVRCRDEVAEFFTGLELVRPGVVRTPEWRPELDEDGELGPAADPATIWAVGGVGRTR